MAKRRGGYRRGSYKFTARRRAALKKAQLKSAQKRKGSGKKIAIAAGAIGGLAAVAYLGSRHRGKISGNKNASRNAVQPGSKESTRIANAISVGNPSRTTTITEGDRVMAQATRNRLNRAAPIPGHMRGATDRQTERSVRRTLRNARKAAATGQKTAALKGTPGGTKTPKKANPNNEARKTKWTEENWKAALAFDEMSVRQPLSGGKPADSGSRATPQRSNTSNSRTSAFYKQQEALDKILGVKLSGNDREAAINAAMNANPGVSRETVIKKLRL